MDDQPNLFNWDGFQSPSQSKPIAAVPERAVIHNLPLFTGIPERVHLPDQPVTIQIDLRDPETANLLRLAAEREKESKA